MKERIIVGNMKLGMLKEDALNYVKKFKGEYRNVVLCPSSIYLNYFSDMKVKLGLQNVFYDGTLCTGEISSSQAVSMGIKYVIIGHSERREYLEENNDIINKKVKDAVKHNLGILLCVGETEEEKEDGRADGAIKRQVYTALKGIDNIRNVVIAYEPVWAIGTNKIPTVEEIKEKVSLIKRVTKELLDYDGIRVLYGGSVNEENVEQLNQIEEISGFLIGGACTNPKKFEKIIKIINKR